MESPMKLSRSEKDRRRREKLKSENAELYREKLDLRNEKRKQRREKLKSENAELYREKLDLKNEKQKQCREKHKSENPEEYRRQQDLKNEKQNRKRVNYVFENPEEHKKYLLKQRQLYLDDKIESWNNLFDTYFEKNKVEMSRRKWETLKKSEIEMYGKLFNFDVSIPFLYEIRQENLEFLRKNLDVCCAGSLIFFIKTFVHHAYDKRKLTKDEKEWVKNVELDKYSPEIENFYRKEYYKNNRESEIEKQKLRNDEKSAIRKNVNLNLLFIDADPNKVLSVSDICFNPTMTNYSVREEFKVNLWKNLTKDEKPEFLEKWKIQRQNYEKEVEELSVEYKTDFLKKMGDKNYSAERESRHEKYLDHFRTLEE